MNFTDVEQARALLRDYLSPTRLISAPSLGNVTGADVYLKLESENPTGSFKVRGALNALGCRQKRGRLEGVATSSTGNHGAGVAYAARQFNLPAAIFLPENPNPVKRARIAQLGAQIFEAGWDLEESRRHAAQFAQERGWPLLVDVDDADICAGAATIACEILEQLPGTAAIIIPVGDSNLIRGVAFAAKHQKAGIEIVGVQAGALPPITGRGKSTAPCTRIRPIPLPTDWRRVRRPNRTCANWGNWPTICRSSPTRKCFARSAGCC